MSVGTSVFRIVDNQEFDISIQEVDAVGNPVGSLPTGVTPTYVSSDPTIVTVSPGTDPLVATVATTGKLGVAQVSVSVAVDANKTLTGLLNLEVVAGDATSLSMTPTNVRDKA